MLQKYYKLLMLVAIPVWVVISFFAAQAIVLAVAWVLVQLNISLVSMNETLLNTISTALTYVITLLLVIGAPWLIKKRKTTITEIGLDRLPKWTEIFITPAGLIVYLLLSAFFLMLASKFVPSFDANQVQEVGFGHLSQKYEYLLAFFVLVVAVPVAEEVLFRGYLFGKLKKFVPLWAAILVTSVVFGALHGNLNVIVDTIALSIVLCILRQVTGSIWPSILLHMTKNGIAFYFLFINTSFLTTMGG